MSQMPMESAVQGSRLEGGLESGPASKLEGGNGTGDGDSHHAGHMQASMFDEPLTTAGLEAYTSTYEQLDEPFYDPLEDFSQESMEIDLEDVMEQQATSFEARELVESPSSGVSSDASKAVSNPTPSSEPASEWMREVNSAAQPAAESASIVDPPGPTATVGQVETSSHGADPVALPEADALPAVEAMTVLTADDFAALEDRILRAVSLVKREREARTLAESQLAAAEAQKLHLQTQAEVSEAQVHALEAQLREQQAEHQAQSPVMERLEREIDALRAEREQVRQRVERLLGQLDALEL